MPDDAVAGSGVTAAQAAPQVLAGKTVGVVGGGPGGLLCAAHLARLGAFVEVFEWRDPAAVDADTPPPPVWSLELTTGSQRAIEAAGLSSDFGPKWRFEGAAMHTVGRPPRFVGEWANAKGTFDFIALVTQPAVVAHLTAECCRVYRDSVTVTHRMRGVGGRVCEGEVVLEDAAGERVTRQFDLVVGADGAGSTVRDLMRDQDRGLTVNIATSALGIVSNHVTSPGHPTTFSTLETPSKTPFLGAPDGYEGALAGCIVNFVQAAPQPDIRAGKPTGLRSASIAVRHGGSEVGFTVSCAASWWEEARTKEELGQALEAAFPHVPRVWLLQTAAQLNRQSASCSGGLRVRRPKFVTCSKLASGRAVLIGDAAHAVSPKLGMGCNAALQDGEVLSRACIATAGNVAAAALAYNAERLRAVQALVHVDKRIDQASTYMLKYHRNALAALAGLPYHLAYTANTLPPSSRVPSFLRPQFSIKKIFKQTEDWPRAQSAFRWYAARLAAAALAAVAAIGAALSKIFALLPV